MSTTFCCDAKNVVLNIVKCANRETQKLRDYQDVPYSERTCVEVFYLETVYIPHIAIYDIGTVIHIMYIAMEIHTRFVLSTNGEVVS